MRYALTAAAEQCIPFCLKTVTCSRSVRVIVQKSRRRGNYKSGIKNLNVCFEIINPLSIHRFSQQEIGQENPCLVFFLKCAELFGYIVYIIFGSDFLYQKDGIETVFLFLPNKRIMLPDGRNNDSPDVILIMLRIAGIHQTNVKRGILCIPDQLLTVAVFKADKSAEGNFFVRIVYGFQVLYAFDMFAFQTGRFIHSGIHFYFGLQCVFDGTENLVIIFKTELIKTSHLPDGHSKVAVEGNLCDIGQIIDRVLPVIIFALFNRENSFVLPEAECGLRDVQ